MPSTAFPDVTQIHNGPVTCHAFNKDRTQVALCPNNNEVHIYAIVRGNWELADVLCEHDKLITSIDWAPETNRIVTASQDRNAYVWTYDTALQKWKPTLVLLRLNRAATCVRWSPFENKFAVGSGAKLISICYFEEENDWWISKHIKKPIASTVLSIDWHPNNVLLAAGSADNKTRVFSAFVKGIDTKPSPTVWGDKLPFGTLCAEYSANGWIHGVSFSPDGDRVAWVSHDATVSVASPATGNVISSVTTQSLPYTCLAWINDNMILTAGHDCVPVIFSESGGVWTQSDKLDSGKKSSVSGSSPLASSAAFNKFKAMDTRAQAAPSETTLNSVHQNTITSIRPHSGTRNKVSAVSTSGVDGKIVVWNLLEAGIAGLRI